MTTQKTATLFLSNITCLDHAWADKNSENQIRGGSFMASFRVTGNVDPTEQVVVDFSTLKKTIKNIIDDPEQGLDHKLWVFPRAWSMLEEKTLDGEKRVLLENNTVKLDIPRNAIHLILIDNIATNKDQLEAFNENGYCVETASWIVENLVQKRLEKIYPGILVECVLTEEPQPIATNQYILKKFNYFHGLKDSTSWACQNIAHGHLSFVSFIFKDSPSVKIVDEAVIELEDLVDGIGNAVYVYEANIDFERSTIQTMVVSYSTPERGLFEMHLDTTKNKIVVLEEETTIENLVKNLVSMYCDVVKLKSLGVEIIEMSEGLQKGAFLRLS